MLSAANAMNAVSANGYRSEYKPGKLDSAEGRLPGGSAPGPRCQQLFHSKLFELLKGDSQRLESLATEMYALGWSTRDIEAAFTDENGVCLLSQTRPCHVDPRGQQRAARGHHSDGTGAAQPSVPGIGDPAR